MSDQRPDVGEHVDTITEWCDFDPNRVYVLWIIARGKYNPELRSSTEIVHRRVLTAPEDVAPALRDLLAIAARHHYHFGVYLSLNARDVRKAFLAFQADLVDITGAFIYGDAGQMRRAERLDSEWISVLQQKRSAADSYFQFDLDDVTESEREQFVSAVPAAVRHVATTPNGYHVITDSFDYTDWESPVDYDELSTDGQLFVFEKPRSPYADADEE